MHIETNYRSKRPGRARSRATELSTGLTATSLKNPLKRFWDIISFRIYREAWQIVWQAVVDRYIDKSYEEYCQEASQLGKLLCRLHYAVNSKDAELIHEAMNEAAQYIADYQKAHANRKDVARPGE